MINSQEIKIGTCIRMDGGIWKCIDFQHRKPGKGNTVMNTKLKNVADGRVLERTFQVVSSLMTFAWSIVLTSISTKILLDTSS